LNHAFTKKPGAAEFATTLGFAASNRESGIFNVAEAL